MATKLHRLGQWAFDNKKKVLAGWLAVLALVFASMSTFGDEFSSKFEVPGTESQEAQDLLAERYPGAGGSSARVVYVAPDGKTLKDKDMHAAVMQSADQASHSKDVIQVVDPYTSGAITKDGRIGFTDVIYPTPADEVDDAARDQLEATAEPAEAAGMQVEFGGGLVSDESEAKSESLGIMVGFLVLAITLGSLVAAGLPLLTALIGVGISVGTVTALTGVLDLTETAPILATMLGLAVGIDYALFILARHRQNVGDGLSPRDAAAKAAGTAGSAVVFAGTTVVIALLGLMVVGIPFLTVMGLAAAGAVVIAVLTSLTLLPALLGFFGDRVMRANRWLARRPRGRKAGRETASVRYARFVVKRPWKVLVAGLAVLLVMAVPAMGMKLGLPDGGYQSTDTTERRAYDLLSEGFGPGFNATLTVAVDAQNLGSMDQARIPDAAYSYLKDTPGVVAVSPPSRTTRAT